MHQAFIGFTQMLCVFPLADLIGDHETTSWRLTTLLSSSSLQCARSGAEIWMTPSGDNDILLAVQHVRHRCSLRRNRQSSFPNLFTRGGVEGAQNVPGDPQQALAEGAGVFQVLTRHERFVGSVSGL